MVTCYCCGEEIDVDDAYNVEGEYWFPIITVKQLNKNVKVIFIEDEKEIIEYVNNLKELK